MNADTTLPQKNREKLCRTVFSFGSPCDGQYGHCVFREDGSIYGYEHPNEHAWTYAEGELRLHAPNGDISSRFKLYDESDVWLGYVNEKKWPLYFIPILKLGDPLCRINGTKERPSFFVNSIPKSGTYYVEAALQGTGIIPQRLHLSGKDIVDDYRGLESSKIHTEPGKTRLTCELELITALLRGEQVVGHVEYQWVIDRIRAQQVCVLSLIRNLRNVLVSLFRFKKSKVLPINSMDEFWRKLPDSEQFIGFLIYHVERDISHIRAVAEMMHSDSNAILLRYEDICIGNLSIKAKQQLNIFEQGIADRLCNKLKKQYGKLNPTYSGEASDWKSVWSPDVEGYFSASGLLDINNALGYK